MDTRALVEALVKAMVDEPEAVRLSELEGTQTVVLELAVAPADLGKVIGKKGVNADALRRIVHAIGGKARKRYTLEIIEPRA